MKLFHMRQDINDGYDTFDSAVVAAETAEAARLMHPYGDSEKIWDGKRWIKGLWEDRTWAPPENISVVEIGTANEGVSGVICASFNAG